MKRIIYNCHRFERKLEDAGVWLKSHAQSPMDDGPPYPLASTDVEARMIHLQVKLFVLAGQTINSWSLIHLCQFFNVLGDTCYLQRLLRHKNTRFKKGHGRFDQAK